jgi:hypothetical protein
MTIKAEVKTMALKNLFDMVKADRYTADGREAIIKAQEAETEDARRTYQIGEISEATGLQKTANGWVKPKSGKQPGAKTGAGEVTRTQKEEVIRKELGLRGENDLDRFSDEQIEKMYQKTQQTPEQKKADFDNSKIGQAYNKARAETPRSGNTARTDQSTKKAIEKYKNLPGPQKKDALNAASYEGSSVGMTQEGMERQGWDLVESDNQINVYAKPDGSKVTMKHDGKTITETNYEAPAPERKPAAAPKLNQVEKVDGANRPYRIKGTQFYFNTPEEAENAILAKNRGGTTYARPSQDPTVNNIQESLGFRLDTPYGGKHSMDDFMKKTGENEYAANVWSFGTDSKGTLINPLSETDKPNATIKKENGEWKLHYKDREGKETVVTANGRQDPTEDAAPRQLTGDTKIRVKKA